MKTRFNGLLTFMFALMPGAGYMYLGLTRKGLESMLVFLTAAVLPAWVGLEAVSAILGFSLWFYFFFETFAVRNRIEEGIEVPDEGYSDVFSELGDKKFVFLGVGLVIIGGLALLNNISNDLVYLESFRRYFTEYLPPVLMIAAGAYLLLRGRNKSD